MLKYMGTKGVRTYVFRNGVEIDKDFIIGPSDFIRNHWWRGQGHYLTLDDLDILEGKEVKTLVIGSGTQGMMQVSQEVKDKYDVVILKTPEAVTRYAELSKIRDGVFGAFHLTC